MQLVAAPEFFFFSGGGGRSSGQNAILRVQKSKHLPKMADFGHFFLGGGEQVGESIQGGGGQMTPCPLDAATECNIIL